MRIKNLLIVVVIVAVFFGGLLTGRTMVKLGNPDSPSAPANTYSYTLEDIYNRLNAGTEGDTTTFTEPAVGPGTPTMHTLNEIMAKAPVKDDANGADTGDVLAGKTFWGLNTASGQWGLQTGSHACITCSGTMVGTRWCDNENGTVTDMTTGLVWLKKADWGGTKPWRRLTDMVDCAHDADYICYDDAHTRAGRLDVGASGADLNDGSDWDEWRLPTMDELFGLAHGTEPVSSDSMRAFTGVQGAPYWSSTTDYGTGGLVAMAWCVDMTDGIPNWVHKNTHYNVWPVRGP